jgi:hypothetical protein
MFQKYIDETKLQRRMHYLKTQPEVDKFTMWQSHEMA